MKNKILIFVTLVVVSIATYASTSTTHINRYYNNYGESFTFVERGVTFAVFQNGEFDFYINPRNDINLEYRNRNINISFNAGYNYDAYVQYDYYGAIIQVEDIPIYYDYYGRVDRIGTININYRNGRLARLGGLRVYYNNYGLYSHFSGYINVYNRNYVFHPYHNFFVRPLFDYRVVSYRPYRNNYRPTRYTYHRNHSRNKYYNNGNKRASKNTRSRIATNKIPKRKSDKVVRVNRNTKRVNETSIRNSRSNVTNNSTRRITANNRNTSDRNSNRSTSIKNRSTQKRNTTINNGTARTRTITSTTKTIKRSPVKTKKTVSSATKRKPTSVKQNRSKIVAQKSKNVKSRKPVKKENRKTTNTRKRRS
jgi:hypothetical protein